jgi:hypothetical protein
MSANCATWTSERIELLKLPLCRSFMRPSRPRDRSHPQRRHREDEPPGSIAAQGCDRQRTRAKACRKACASCHLGRMSAMRRYAPAGRASGGEKLAEWEIKSRRSGAEGLSTQGYQRDESHELRTADFGHSRLRPSLLPPQLGRAPLRLGGHGAGPSRWGFDRSADFGRAD